MSELVWPSTPTGFRQGVFYPSDGDGVVSIDWNESTHPPLPSGGTPPTVTGYSVRYQLNGGAWSAWTPAQDVGFELSGVAVGTAVNLQVQAINTQGSRSSVGAGSLTIVELLEDPMVAEMAASTYAERYGTTMPVARAWITVQSRSSTIQDAVRSSSSGAGFGNAWFDNATRKLVVNLKDGTSTAGAQTALNNAGLGPDSRIQMVRNTAAELEDGYLAISDQLEDLQLAGLITMSSDDSANRVVITQATSTTAAQRTRIAQAASAASVQVSVIQGTDASYSDGVVDARCSAFLGFSSDYPSSAYPYGPAFCSNPMRGGIDIYPDRRTDPGSCTTGFLVRSQRSGNPFVLTSGHCIRDTGGADQPWSSYAYEFPVRTERVGLSGRSEDDKNRDFGVISIAPGGYWSSPIRPIILVRGRNGVTQRRDRKRIRTIQTNKQGEMICTSGANTGGHCGEILAVGRDLPGTGGTQWAYFDACERTPSGERRNPIRGGDSGAPVFTQTGAARGIIKGFARSNNCIAYFQSAFLAARELQVDLVTR